MSEKFVKTYIDDEGLYVCKVHSFLGFHSYEKIRKATYFNDDIPYEPIGHNALVMVRYMMALLFVMVLLAIMGTPR